MPGRVGRVLGRFAIKSNSSGRESAAKLTKRLIEVKAGERFKAPFDLRLELWRRDADALAELSSPPPFAAELRRQLDALLAAREEALHNA